MEGIRWQQRFANFEKALNQLSQGIDTAGANPMDLIKEGIIQRFEFTHELAWKVMKDYLKDEGFQNISGSRTTTREAFNVGLITNGELWMSMIESRNNTVHTYNEGILENEYKKITEDYFALFKDFYAKMKTML